MRDAGHHASVLRRRSCEARRDAVERFLKACQQSPRTVELGRIQRQGQAVVWFMCALSVGFDPLVNERANGWRRPHGPMRHKRAILRELATLKPLAYSLVVDGHVRRQRAILLSISNLVSIGGGMKITPEAKCGDGRLDVSIVSAGVLAHADGERIGPLPATIKVDERALQLWV